MPSYQYECQYCSKQWTEYHSFDEAPSMCPFCEQKEFKKVYNYTTNINKPIEQKDSGKVGSKTRQFIEESKQELEEYKEKMRGK